MTTESSAGYIVRVDISLRLEKAEPESSSSTTDAGEIPVTYFLSSELAARTIRSYGPRALCEMIMLSSSPSVIEESFGSSQDEDSCSWSRIFRTPTYTPEGARDVTRALRDFSSESRQRT